MNPCIESVPPPGASASLLVLSEALTVMRQLMQRDPGCASEAQLLRSAAVAVVGQHDVEACFLFMHQGTGLSCEAIAARAPGSGEVVLGDEAEREDADEYLSLARQIAERGEPLCCSALARVPGQVTERWRPVLGHALKHAGTRVGVAVLRFVTPDLEPWHDRLLGLFADLLALRLVTARLLHRQRRALDSSKRARDVTDTELQLQRRRCADAQRLLHVQGQRISYQATHDVLTGLLNRRGLLCRLRDLVAKPSHAGNGHGMLYLDVDRFRLVNDACGHLVGDHLMKQTGRAIATHLRGDEIGGRMGNDAFAVLLPGHSRARCLAKAAALREAVANIAFAHPGPPLETTLSIGLTTFAGHELGAEEIFHQARVACSVAKEEGGNQVQVYRDGDERLRQRIRETQWVPRLLRALQEDRFELVAQPLVPVAGTNTSRELRTCGYELLIRYVDDGGALVSAAEFMPAAERFGLSVKIDELVVRKALAWLGSNPAWVADAAFVTINLSGHSLGRGTLLDSLACTIRGSNVPAQKLVFEVTETAAISDLGTSRTFFESLRATGCRFALDDFGSGHASFAYLRDLPVDMIKIDGEFVRAMAADTVSASLVRTINQLGHELGLRTVAECVESESVLESLREVGVDYAQGFLLGAPVPLSALTRASRDNERGRLVGGRGSPLPRYNR